MNAQLPNVPNKTPTSPLDRPDIAAFLGTWSAIEDDCQSFYDGVEGPYFTIARDTFAPEGFYENSCRKAKYNLANNNIYMSALCKVADGNLARISISMRLISQTVSIIDGRKYKKCTKQPNNIERDSQRQFSLSRNSNTHGVEDNADRILTAITDLQIGTFNEHNQFVASTASDFPITPGAEVVFNFSIQKVNSNYLPGSMKKLSLRWEFRAPQGTKHETKTWISAYEYPNSGPVKAAERVKLNEKDMIPGMWKLIAFDERNNIQAEKQFLFSVEPNKPESTPEQNSIPSDEYTPDTLSAVYQTYMISKKCDELGFSHLSGQQKREMMQKIDQLYKMKKVDTDLAWSLADNAAKGAINTFQLAINNRASLPYGAIDYFKLECAAFDERLKQVHEIVLNRLGESNKMFQQKKDF